jgi:hypothetical protein
MDDATWSLSHNWHHSVDCDLSRYWTECPRVATIIVILSSPVTAAGAYRMASREADKIDDIVNDSEVFNRLEPR